MSVNVHLYICEPFLCAPKFALSCDGARVKVQAHYNEGVVIPNVHILHSTVCTLQGQLQYVLVKNKKQKFAIWNAPLMSQF